MKFTIDIEDEDHLAGLTAARESFNESLVLEKDQAREDHPDYLADDQAYVQRVMGKAAESYAKQHVIVVPEKLLAAGRAKSGGKITDAELKETYAAMAAEAAKG